MSGASSMSWRYFQNNTEAGIAICKICKEQLKNKRVFNLKRHLFEIHNIGGDENINEEGEDSTTLIAKYKKRKLTVSVSLEEMTNAYISLIVKGSVSFNVLDDPDFRTLIDPICDAMSLSYNKRVTFNASNCKKTLKIVADNLKKEISKDLENKLISLKIDSGSQLGRTIFGVSAQILKNSNIKSFILGMVDLKGQGSSTSKCLPTEVLKVLQKYNIQLNQVVSITSDNGANMIKATNILSSESEEAMEDLDDVSNEDYITKIEEMEKVPNVLIGNVQVCRCAAHTVQLIALDAMKSENIWNNLWNCRNISKYIRKSSEFRELFEFKKFKMPQLDCPTRWGSSYNMVRNLLDAKETISDIKLVQFMSDNEYFEIGENAWDFMDSYCTAFGPLNTAIVKFQAEQMHYGNFYTEWWLLKIRLENIIMDSKNGLTIEMAEHILKAMEKRSKTLMNNKFLLSCLYLDPRFHCILNNEERQTAILHLKSIWDRLQVLDTTSLQPESQTNEELFDDPIRLALQQQLEARTKETTNDKESPHEKIERLQLSLVRNDTNVLNFWKEKESSDPELYAISCVCFAVPSTPVSVERAFSSLKVVLAENRNRLSEELLENILIAKLNPIYVKTAIDSLSIFEDESISNN